MMGTLAGEVSGKEIPTAEDRYWAAVEGDIEDVNGILKITPIRVSYHLKIAKEKESEAGEAVSSDRALCAAAQCVIGCIQIRDSLVIEEVEG